MLHSQVSRLIFLHPNTFANTRRARTECQDSCAILTYATLLVTLRLSCKRLCNTAKMGAPCEHRRLSAEWVQGQMKNVGHRQLPPTPLFLGGVPIVHGFLGVSNSFKLRNSGPCYLNSLKLIIMG